MLTHKEMVGLQAEKHDLITTELFPSREAYVLHLIHTAAYVQAARFAGQKRVLDIGCNTGYGTDILFGAAPRELIGVDVSEKAVQFARKHYERPGLQFLTVNGEQLPFEDNRFDVIVSFQVIEHIVDYQTFIGELKRVLAPSGMVLFTTPNAHLRLNPGMKPWYPFHVREFTPDELATLLELFFRTVKVHGLFAAEPLYRIEFNRLDRARRVNADTTSMRARLKKALPQPVRSGVRRLFDRMRKRSALAPDDEFIRTYSVNDFFYRGQDLEKALDLIAVCSDEGDVPVPA